MPIDDRTTGRAYQLPNTGNYQGDDVERLRAALAAIDADIVVRYTKTEVDSLVNGLLESPALTGTPTAPTAPVDTNTFQLATTAFVIAQSYLKAAAAAVTYAPLFSPVFTGSPQLPSINGGPLSGTRNRLINGGMLIDQRNNGAVQTFTAGTTAYCLDRWVGYCIGANVTGQQVQGATLGQSRYRFNGAPGVTNISFDQRIESSNCADLAGNTVTFSIELANSLLTIVDWDIEYANAANNFNSRTLIATGKFTVTSTVNRFTATITLPAAAVNGILVRVSVGSQSSGTFTIGNAQVELGSIATPFERRLIAQELNLCKRYGQWVPFNMLFYASVDGQYMESSISWHEMRKIPVPGALVADPYTTQSAYNNSQNIISRATPYGGSCLLQATTGNLSSYVTGYRSWLDAEL